MLNFIYQMPTKFYFGKGQTVQIGKIVKDYGKKLLLVYGGGSIKKSGLYDTVVKALEDESIVITELSGIVANPRIDKVREGIALCRQNNIDMVLAVGGGSALDTAKAIAAGVFYNGDVWDLFMDPGKITDALPIFTILTLAATGSEMNGGTVITNPETSEKIGIKHDAMRPKVSVLDPSLTFTVAAYQTGAGTVDIMSHILEGYFTRSNDCYMQLRMAEGFLKTCIHYGPIAIADPANYEARANLMWASSWAQNGVLKAGVHGSSTVHPIEHELSAFYDITHAAGLAILTPAWMKYILSDNTVDDFYDYGVNVWGIGPTLDRYEVANRSIEKTRAFFRSMGMPTTLREVGIGSEKFDAMANHVAPMLKNIYVPLDAKDIKKIFEMAL